MDTPDTLNYMIAGYGFLFGLALLYIASWHLRRRNLEKDIDMIQTLAADKPK